MAVEHCPYCAEIINRTDKVCPHCQRALTGKALLENPPSLVHDATAMHRGDPPPRGAKYCPNCGTVAKPRYHTKGSFAIEVALWLILIVPGVVYSIWRLTSKVWVCPKCGSERMIPIDSPKARAALATVRPTP